MQERRPMHVLHPICCGIDVHAAQLTACLRRVSDDGQITTELVNSGTTYRELIAFRTCLQEHRRSQYHPHGRRCNQYQCHECWTRWECDCHLGSLHDVVLANSWSLSSGLQTTRCLLSTLTMITGHCPLWHLMHTYGEQAGLLVEKR